MRASWDESRWLCDPPISQYTLVLSGFNMSSRVTPGMNARWTCESMRPGIFLVEFRAVWGRKHTALEVRRNRGEGYSLRFSVDFQSRRYREMSTDHSCCGARITVISSAVP
jgi:hypothetical protein